MWLLDAKTLQLEFQPDEKAKPYAILSHTWGEEEVSFREVQQGTASSKKGYEKIRSTCRQALEDGLEYTWVDTCCINKESDAELGEAIRSMYRWYSAARVCYAFLSDVGPDSLIGDTPSSSRDANLRRVSQSRWFTRGWTLQELLAPKHIKFFGAGWSYIGTKAELADEIALRTGIQRPALSGRSMESFNVATKMRWAAYRSTARIEDRAYSLLGIFDINMPLLYGEGSKAFQRLQEVIIQTSLDHSVFCWEYEASEFENEISPSSDSEDDSTGLSHDLGGNTEEPRVVGTDHYYADLLAASPENFASFPEEVTTWVPQHSVEPFHLSNRGLEIALPMIRTRFSTDIGVINCRTVTNFDGPLALKLFPQDQRVLEEGETPVYVVDNSYGDLLGKEGVTREQKLSRLQFVPLTDAESATRVQCAILRYSLALGLLEEESTSQDERLKVLVRCDLTLHGFQVHGKEPKGAWYNDNLFVPRAGMLRSSGSITWRRDPLREQSGIRLTFQYPEGPHGFRLALTQPSLPIDSISSVELSFPSDHSTSTELNAVESMKLDDILEGAGKTAIAWLDDGLVVSAAGRATYVMDEWVFLIEVQQAGLYAMHEEFETRAYSLQIGRAG